MSKRGRGKIEEGQTVGINERIYVPGSLDFKRKCWFQHIQLGDVHVDPHDSTLAHMLAFVVGHPGDALIPQILSARKHSAHSCSG